MDHQNNIDRLFREKLDGMEVTPSAQAWSQVEKRIRPQKTPVLYWIAASVSLLFIAWMAWPALDVTSSDKVVSEVNYPTVPDASLFETPIAAELSFKKQKVKEVQQPVTSTTHNAHLATQNAKIPKQNEEIVTALEIAPATIVAMEEVETPTILEKVEEQVKSKPDFRTVKITYIAARQGDVAPGTAQSSDSTGVLKKFIAFAEKLDPGDVLADIKTAKDNFISSGLKGKKERSSLNP